MQRRRPGSFKNLLQEKTRTKNRQAVEAGCQKYWQLEQLLILLKTWRRRRIQSEKFQKGSKRLFKVKWLSTGVDSTLQEGIIWQCGRLQPKLIKGTWLPEWPQVCMMSCSCFTMLHRPAAKTGREGERAKTNRTKMETQQYPPLKGRPLAALQVFLDYGHRSL